MAPVAPSSPSAGGSFPDTGALRRLALAVSLFEGVELVQVGHGVRVGAATISWIELRLSIEGLPAESLEARRQAARWLRLRGVLATSVLSEVREQARIVALPVDHPLIGDPAWVRACVPGGVLAMGLGWTGLDASSPSSIHLVPPALLELADVPGPELSALWVTAQRRLEALGQVAADRLRHGRDHTVRPCGGADAVTLLASRTLRSSIVASSGASGLAAVCAPTLERAWTDVRRIDPAYVKAVASLVEPHERGFDRPLLVTADEVGIAALHAGH